MRMRVGFALMMGVTFMAITGCGDSTGLTPEDLEGTWNATQIIFIDNATSSDSVDIVLMGASFTMTVSASGSVSTVFDDGEGGTSSDSGTISSDGSTVTIGSDTYEAERSGNRLTLTDPDEFYDFDDDGSDDSATLVAHLQRQ